MPPVEYARLVREMMEAQQRYFRRKDPGLLAHAKALEDRVRQETRDILDGRTARLPFGDGED